MSRLTKPYHLGGYTTDMLTKSKDMLDKSTTIKELKEGIFAFAHAAEELLNHLVSYENACHDGYYKEVITPEEIAELAKAKVEGRLIPPLPCKVGDELFSFIPNFKCVVELTVEEFVLLSNSLYIICRNEMSNERRGISFDKIGKTVFLTQEAAEAALNKSKGEFHE